MIIFNGTTLSDFLENVGEHVRITVKNIDSGILYEYNGKDEWDDTYDSYMLVDFLILNERVVVWVE